MKKRILAIALALALILPLEMLPVRSDVNPGFQLSFELYPSGSGPPGSASAKPQFTKDDDGVSQLTADSDFLVALKYTDLKKVGAGVECLAITFTYDSQYLTVNKFADGNRAVKWTSDAETISNAWATSPLSTDAYTASAVDRPAGDSGTLREVYLQYIAEGKDGKFTDILTSDTNNGYLGAFSFHVEKAIPTEADASLVWTDYKIGVFKTATLTVDNTENYYKEALNATAPPQRLATAESTGPATIDLKPGNATADDIAKFGAAGSVAQLGVSESTVFVYNGYGFRDPGFEPTEGVTRTYLDGAEEKTLPAWTAGEVLTGFTVRNDEAGRLKYSDHYTIVYKQGDVELGRREVFVIFKRGDVSRDGNISTNDGDSIIGWFYGRESIELSDPLYKLKTVDVTGDGNISTNDGDSIIGWFYGREKLEQEYGYDSNIRVMIF